MLTFSRDLRRRCRLMILVTAQLTLGQLSGCRYIMDDVYREGEMNHLRERPGRDDGEPIYPRW